MSLCFFGCFAKESIMRNLTVLTLVAAGLWAVSLTTPISRAAADAETNGLVNGIADMLAKGDTAGAKKAAGDLKKLDYETVMHAFKPRSKGGIGVGPKGSGITPDGIELKINAIARDGITGPAMKKEGDALVRVGYVTEAMAQFAVAKPWDAPMGKKTPAAWNEWADKMVTASAEFTKAAKGGSAADLKKAASNIKNTCDGCHAIFK
jgi:hypothetical protein